MNVVSLGSSRQTPLSGMTLPKSPKSCTARSLLKQHHVFKGKVQCIDYKRNTLRSQLLFVFLGLTKGAEGKLALATKSA